MLKTLSDIFRRLWHDDKSVAALILVLFLCTNRYIYGWDNQHLEIPLLKHLIDPQLYAGDYYVESAAKHFSSLLFPLLAKFITVAQIPIVYLTLFLICRFAMFFSIFRIWILLSRDRLIAFLLTISMFLLGRTEGFIFRTFSHEVAAYALVFVGLYFFYKERYFFSAFILGVGADFNALCSLYPILFLLGYLVFFEKNGFKKAFPAGVLFVIAALPFLFWDIPQRLAMNNASPPTAEWVRLYYLGAPQAFPLSSANPNEVLDLKTILLGRIYPFVFLLGLHVFLFLRNSQFRQDKKTQTVLLISWILIAANFYFGYFHPSRFVINLNLGRCIDYLRLFLLGYGLLYIMERMRRQGWNLLIGGLAICFLGWFSANLNPSHWLIRMFPLLIVLGAGYAWIRFFPSKDKNLWPQKFFLIIPFLGMFFYYCYVHYEFVQISQHGGGFWQLERNWEDMQLYVRDHTPKNALILTPYDTEMGGFRIRSERSVLVCYRDSGIIGFDYDAIKNNWQERIKDIEAFKVFPTESIIPAVVTAIKKYKVDYIVFMRYDQPRGASKLLKKLYENEVFALYQVTFNPV